MKTALDQQHQKYSYKQDGFTHTIVVESTKKTMVFKAQNPDEAKKEAREVYEALKAGKDLQELAKDHSDLPSVGTIEEGQLKPQIEEKVFHMKEGEISEPMDMDNGIYIFRFNRQSPRQTKSLKDAKEEIYAQLFEDKFKKRFSEWISKMREKAYVEIRS